MKIKRKDFLKKGLLATAAIPLTFSACANNSEGQSSDAPNINTGKKYKWRMVTTWPPNFPVFGEVADYLSDWIKTMSNGRLEIKTYGSGELVPGLEAFDTVSSGTVEMGSGASYYWAGKSPASSFFAAVPFGMNAQQIQSWLLAGGGYELWKEVYAKFNLIPFIAGNSGVQMGGWFNKEINSIDDMKGLKMRIPGFGGKAVEKAGGAPITVAGGEIYTNLERGVIDATEWVGPYHDYKMGFHKVAKYYYTPGWHEPGAQLEFFVNKSAFESLPKDLQVIVETACHRAHTWVISEFDAKNIEYLDKIMNESDVEIKRFPKEVLTELRKYTKIAVEEAIADDPLALKVYDSYTKFQKSAARWSEMTEKAFYNDIQSS